MAGRKKIPTDQQVDAAIFAYWKATHGFAVKVAEQAWEAQSDEQKEAMREAWRPIVSAAVNVEKSEGPDIGFHPGELKVTAGMTRVTVIVEDASYAARTVVRTIETTGDEVNERTWKGLRHLAKGLGEESL